MSSEMLVFHNGSNTSYANFAANLSSMSTATTAVTLRFLGQGASATATSTDSVVLTVDAGTEEAVMEFIARIVAKGSKGGMTVIADDNSSIYSNQSITAVDSISVDTGAGTFKNIIVGAWSSDNITVTNAQSGSLVTLPVTGDNSTITLPSSPVDGANYKFVAEADNGAHTITMAGAFEGIVVDGGATDQISVVQIDGTTSFVVAASKFKIGDFFECVYSGSAGGWKINGVFLTDAAASAS
mgnify:CR=1 FL=1